MKAFFGQFNLKLKCNLNHFVRQKQDTKYIILSYANCRLEEDVWTQIEPYVFINKIDFKSIDQYKDLLNIRFGEINPIEMAKHKLYHFYQYNKDLKVFLNTFL